MHQEWTEANVRDEKKNSLLNHSEIVLGKFKVRIDTYQLFIFEQQIPEFSLGMIHIWRPLSEGVGREWGGKAKVRYQTLQVFFLRKYQVISKHGIYSPTNGLIMWIFYLFCFLTFIVHKQLYKEGNKNLKLQN